MICSCGVGRSPAPTSPHHAADCLVAQAMRWRCPECKSRRRPERRPEIRHTNLCPLKEYQP